MVMVLRLHQKVIDTGFEGVLGSFCVPKSKGRVYVEAWSQEHVVRLATGLHFVYTNSIFAVPIVERVALLDPGNHNPLLQVGEHVKVRNGRYRDDPAEIVDVSEHHTEIVVKLKSRQPAPVLHRPEDCTKKFKSLPSGPKSTPSKNDPPLRGQKRKKKKPSKKRRDPYILDKNLLQTQQKKDKTQSLYRDLPGGDFVYNRSQYSDDGYLLLTMRYDRLERLAKLPEDAFDLTEDRYLFTTPTDPFQVSEDGVVRLPCPKYIREGNVVRINSGPSAGAVGRVVEMTSSTIAVVDLCASVSTHRSTLVQCEIDALNRMFQVGDHIFVRHGLFEGRRGIVSGCNGEKLSIANLQDLSEVRHAPSIVLKCH